jgi:hypothetical protein
MVDVIDPPRDGAGVKLEKATMDRLVLSTRVIAGWEAMGGPMGSPADLLRMIEGEIATLTGLRDQAPAVVDDLVARYTRLANVCRVKIN